MWSQFFIVALHLSELSWVYYAVCLELLGVHKSFFSKCLGYLKAWEYLKPRYFKNLNYFQQNCFYPLDGQFLSTWSKILIVAPHLSELAVLGHIVTAGKETSSMGWDAVSTTMIIGILVHANKGKNTIQKKADIVAYAVAEKQ